MTYWLMNAPFLVIAGVVAAVAVLRGVRPAAGPGSWLLS